MVIKSLAVSVLVAMTVTVVVVAVTPVTVNTWLLKNSVSGEMTVGFGVSGCCPAKAVVFMAELNTTS